jgi:hypothetical protein
MALSLCGNGFECRLRRRRRRKKHLFNEYNKLRRE